MKRLRVLSLSTLFPSPQRPAFGRFVAAQMQAVAAWEDVEVLTINPVGLPPWPLRLRQPWHGLALVVAEEGHHAARVFHPRFTTLPLIGGDSNPARIVRAVLPLARRLHAEAPFDLVDAQFFFPDGPAAAALARDLDVPLTIKARGSDIHYWGGREKALAQMLLAADQAACLLSVSRALAEDMAALGMPGDRIAVHYTGLDRELFHPVKRADARARTAAELSIPADGPLLVTPGALIAIKGQRIAIAALEHLPGTRLALAGAGADEAALRDLAERSGMADRVHFLGQVGHDLLPTLLSAADVMVLPSEREGLANAWVETLACGTPLVIPDIGGAREVVCDETAGRLAERTPHAIAEAVRAVLAARLDQDIVALNAQRFSWEANAAALAALWRAAARAG